MTQQRYRIVFKGETLTGFDPLEAQAHAARLLRAGPAQIALLFSGKQVGIRKDLSAAEAARYRSTLSRIGLRVYAEVMPSAKDGSSHAEGSVTGGMTSPSFRVVYCGEVLQEEERAVVMQRVAQKLQLDDARLSRLFSGKKAILKKGLGAEAAARYLTEAAQLGMLASMEYELTASPVARPTPAAAPAINTKEIEKRFMESAAKTQLYAPRAPLYDEKIAARIATAMPDDTSTVVDIDITRALATESFDPPEEPMPQAKIWRPPESVAPGRSEPALQADVPMSDNSPSPAFFATEQDLTALRSIDLHVAPAMNADVEVRSTRSGALRRLASMRLVLPKALARILN